MAPEPRRGTPSLLESYAVRSFRAPFGFGAVLALALTSGFAGRFRRADRIMRFERFFYFYLNFGDFVTRIGVVGAGTIGRLRVETIKTQSRTSLAAVCDVDPGIASAMVRGTQAAPTTDLEAFFAHPMDAVVVASPIQFHESACLAAFARGLHVLCEKPLSNTAESCQRIVEAAKAAGRVLAVGFNLRYYPAFQFVRQVVDQGTIGDIDHIRLFGGHDGLGNFRADWQFRAPESGAGATMDVGIHMSDLARYFLGDVTEVYGVASERVWEVPGSEDNAMAIFRNPAGVAATYHATWDEWQGYEAAIEVYGRLGMVRAAYAPMQNLLITHPNPGAKRHVIRKRYPEIMVREKLLGWTSTTRRTFDQELVDFLGRMDGQARPALADGHDGWRSVQVSEALRESSRMHEVVRLAPLAPMHG